MDLRILNKRNISFLQQVLGHGKLIFSRNEKRRIRFETDVLKRYLDFKPFIKHYNQKEEEFIGMIDEELIERKVDIILENLEYLSKVRNTKKKEFLDSFEKRQATKHSLQEAIEACLDIANHIIAAKKFERAENYSEMFRVLSEKKILRKELGRSLMNMAKFRNLLVHRYGKIDKNQLWKIFEDIEEFIK